VVFSTFSNGVTGKKKERGQNLVPRELRSREKKAMPWRVGRKETVTKKGARRGRKKEGKEKGFNTLYHGKGLGA